MLFVGCWLVFIRREEACALLQVLELEKHSHLDFIYVLGPKFNLISVIPYTDPVD